MRILVSIVVPNLRRVLEIVLVVNTITAFAFMFTYIYTITNGGPGTDTYVSEFYIYQQAFTNQNMGYAAAIGVTLVLDRVRDRPVPDPHPDAQGRALSVAGRDRSGRRAARDGVGARAANSWPLVVAIGLFCVSAVLPLLFMAATAFRTQADWANAKIGLPTTLSFGAFERAWTGANIGLYFRNSRDRHLRDGRALRRQRDSRRLCVLEAPLAPVGRGVPVRARLDRDPAAAPDGAHLRGDGAARVARHVRLGDLPLHRAQPPVQRLPDDRVLPVGARRADRGRAGSTAPGSIGRSSSSCCRSPSRRSRRSSSSTCSGPGTSSCSLC